MHQFLPEGLHPQPDGYTKEELLLAMQQRKILQAPAIKCDERHDLHIALGCCAGVMPRAEAARGILGGETRDIAILSRVGLTLRELLGTWQENAARFRAGQTVTGIACGKTDYGVFIALTPNLCGLAERDDTLEPGQPVCVYIKAIHPETLKLKLTVLHRLDTVPSQPLRFTKTEGRLDVWRYGSRENAKIVTVF